MRLRIELFVEDLDTSIGFYERTLGFELTRRDEHYASLRRGAAVLGLGPVAALPERGTGAGFTRERLARDRGAGVEIVLEVEDLEGVLATAGQALAEPLQERPWGLRDFRIVDPDGYYLRVTETG
jgi:catechol 2,3-dioxygenase-like lactoylglutathione lyase family enzyme